jgi:hypothetical protein
MNDSTHLSPLAETPGITAFQMGFDSISSNQSIISNSNVVASKRQSQIVPEDDENGTLMRWWRE